MPLPKFPIPEITFFINNNPFCGSVGGFNYRVQPVKADTEKNIDSHLLAYTWYGSLCSDLSERQAEAEFPLDTDGIAAAKVWLEQQETAYRESLES